MNSLPKPIFLWIDLGAYERLRQQVLRREGWRYQSCGRMANLEIHHRNSHSGHDVEENLITLCSTCNTSAQSTLNRCIGRGGLP